MEIFGYGQEVCMTERELRKLDRTSLLKLLLDERRENERLQDELEKANEKLANRDITLEKVGSIAEAALQLNGIFEAAEAAADQYLENVRSRAGEQEK